MKTKPPYIQVVIISTFAALLASCAGPRVPQRMPMMQMHPQMAPAMFNAPPQSGAAFQGQQQTGEQIATMTYTKQWGQEEAGKLGDIIDPTTKKFYRDGPQGTLRESVFKAVISGGRIEWAGGSFGLPKRTAEEAGVSDRITTNEVVETCLIRKELPNPKRPDAPGDMPDLGLLARQRLQAYGVVFQ